MAHDSWLYGDPEKVLIRKQEEEARRHKSCGQCVHRQVLELEGRTLFNCSKGREYGDRRDCRFYRTVQIFRS